MIPQEKVDAVKQYLRSEFPDFEVDDADDFERVSRKFMAVKGSTIYAVKCERRFLDDISDVKKALQDFELSTFMKDNEGKQVLITKQGVIVL